MAHYFYYVRTVSSQTLSPRKASEWPPVGGEPNEVVWKIQLEAKDVKRRLACLDLKFRTRAERDLS